MFDYTVRYTRLVVIFSDLYAQVTVAGCEVHSALTEAFELIGYCPQLDSLWTHATVTELLMFFGISAGLSEEQAESVTN